MRALPTLILLTAALLPNHGVAVQQVGFGPDLPAIVVPYNVTFIAGWATMDGATIPTPGATRFFSVFGDSAPLTAEGDVVAQATFHHNVTNLRVVAGAASCSGLGPGQTFTFVLRKNGAPTALTGSCANGAAINSFTLDQDVVAVVPGDRLSFSITLNGGALSAAARAGVSMMGYQEYVSEIEEVVEVTPFEDTVGLTAWELSAIIVLVVLGLMVNARGRDLGAKVAGATMLLIIGLVALEVRNLWIGGVEAAIAFLLIAGYAFIRAGLDYMNDRNSKPKKTDPERM